MKGVQAGVFLSSALALHLGAFALVSNSVSDASEGAGAQGDAALSLAAQPEQIAALIDAWQTPPETSDAPENFEPPQDVLAPQIDVALDRPAQTELPPKPTSPSDDLARLPDVSLPAPRVQDDSPEPDISDIFQTATTSTPLADTSPKTVQPVPIGQAPRDVRPVVSSIAKPPALSSESPDLAAASEGASVDLTTAQTNDQVAPRVQPIAMENPQGADAVPVVQVPVKTVDGTAAPLTSARPEARDVTLEAAAAKRIKLQKTKTKTTKKNVAKKPAAKKAPAQASRAQRATKGTGQPAKKGTSAGKAKSGSSKQASASARKSAKAKWARTIQSRIARKQKYPRGTRGSGRVTVVITLSRSGGLRGARVAKSSGVAAFDNAALKAVKAARYPPAPKALRDATYSFQHVLRFSR